MIRRISHITIAALLIMSTTGLTIHQHFCMGNLVETSIFHEPEYCCGEGSDCCKNESATYKLKEDFVFFSQLIDFEDMVIILPEMQPLFTGRLEVQTKPLGTYKILYPPDIGTVLARLQVFCL